MIKLFFRDQFPLILVHMIQLMFILLIIWMGGFKDLVILLYALFISLFFLTIYLVYRFITLRSFYKRLADPIARLEGIFEALNGAPVAVALSELLKKQHRLYLNEVEIAKNKKNEHVNFIHQWVHQMKTPLSVIELIIQDYEDEQLLSIQEETDKLEKGLEMVLYAARLEVFEQDFHVKPISLKQTVEEVIRENKRIFIKNRVYPEMNISDVIVESDDKWMVFVITQIVTNAVKYSADKGNKIYIYERISEEGTHLLIQDEGVGIPTSDVKRVFNPFFTGENGRVYRESTGMGLSLVHEICERLEHKVEIASTEGEGTTVTVTFFK